MGKALAKLPKAVRIAKSRGCCSEQGSGWIGGNKAETLDVWHFEEFSFKFTVQGDHRELLYRQLALANHTRVIVTSSIEHVIFVWLLEKKKRRSDGKRNFQSPTRL